MQYAEPLTQRAIKTAEELQARAHELMTDGEQRRQQEMARLTEDTHGKATLTMLTDRAFRSEDPNIIADQFVQILKEHGIPKFFGAVDKTLLRAFTVLVERLHIPPKYLVPKVMQGVMKRAYEVILPGEQDQLEEHLQKRSAEQVRMNLNHLGDMVLGDEEAQTHMRAYSQDLANPNIDYISVKLSTLYPHIHAEAHQDSVAGVSERLAELFRIAQCHPVGGEPKFINLDMEEYRDLDITSDAFMGTLDKPEFQNARAGIVLQAYLPDSFEKQKQLTEWAKTRKENGGAPVKLRIVKGANMAMEKVESSLHGWEQAPFTDKVDTDANYYRMVEYGMQPENIQAVNLGIASHNLFSIAHAHELGKENGVEQYYTFEMLEGMANHTRRAVQEHLGQSLVLYAPLAKKEEILSALGYLMRRLDENTSPENFLSRSFNLQNGSNDWSFLRRQYEQAVSRSESVPSTPRRRQNRHTENGHVRSVEELFRNEPDTDFTLESNRTWADDIRDYWEHLPDQEPRRYGRSDFGLPERKNGPIHAEIHDPSEPNTIMGYMMNPDEIDAENALRILKEDADGWRETEPQKRANILLNAAQILRHRRAPLIGSAMATTGKLLGELDSEVSEAVDFLEYYARQLMEFDAIDTVKLSPKGQGTVVTPFNFPVAIPMGGVSAALAAGNSVVLKPAREAAMTSSILVQVLREAGVPPSALQCLPFADDDQAADLVANEDSAFTVFTGGTDTARKIQEANPEKLLYAETGGKNATIITSNADREQAIKHLVSSAFGNSGQKCSATSLAILVGEVGRDSKFAQQLKDAVSSIVTGSAWKAKTEMGPLIHAPTGPLKEAIETLNEGEEWLVRPQMIGGDNKRLVSPGVKLGVTADSHDYQNELFGPVLGIMRVDTLDEAIELVNGTGYGLTSGIESLDEREQETWKESVRAGNLYINRPTTGAIVRRQPFGGMGKSAVGLGVKAGGPNYLLQFMNAKDTGVPVRADPEQRPQDATFFRLMENVQTQASALQLPAQDVRRALDAAGSYLAAMQEYYEHEHDESNILGEDNILRYRSTGTVVVRIEQGDTTYDTLARVFAARAAGNAVRLSAKNSDEPLLAALATVEDSDITCVTESDDNVAELIDEDVRLRYADPSRVPKKLYESAAEKGQRIADEPPVSEGRIELSRGGYLREQSISNRFHRYGNLLHRT